MDHPCTNNVAATTPASEAMAPTDRSKSPITMTTVMQLATTASIETCWLMFSQLRAVRKVSGRFNAKKTITAAIPARAAETADQAAHAAAPPS